MKSFFYWLSILTLCLYQHSTLANTTEPEARSLDHIVAVVNNDAILRSELDKYLNGVIRQLKSQNTPIPDKSVLEKKGLERLIIRSLQLQRAKKTGIQVDDAALNLAIQDIARKNGMNLKQFRSALVNEKIDYENFREDIRHEIIISRLRKRDVINRIVVNEQEITDYLAREKDLGDKNKLVKFSHILISLPDAASTEQIQAAREKARKVLKLIEQGADFAQTAVAYSDGQKAMEGGEYSFRPVSQVPPLFSKTIANMKVGEVSPLFRSPYGFHIIKLLQVKDKAKHIVSQTKIRHILIRTTALISSHDAKSRLLQLKTRIENGDDFATLARSHSDDTLSAKEGGSLGWVSPGDTVAAFEQIFSTLSPGQISEPFKTRFGWHILQVLDRRQHDDTKKFRRVRAITNIKKQKALEELQSWLRRLRDEAYVEHKLEQHRIR